MKNLLLVLILSLSLHSISQNTVTLNISQDLKLATIGDDKGNDPFTLDLVTAFEWQGYQKQSGYIIVRPEFELAELKGGTYKRFSANVGYTFNNPRSHIPIIRKISATISVGYGFIDYNGAKYSVGNNLQLSFSILKQLQLFLDLETVQRQDLSKFKSETPVLGTVWRTSGKLGFKVSLF